MQDVENSQSKYAKYTIRQYYYAQKFSIENR